MQNNNPLPIHPHADDAAPLSDLETKMLAVEYEVWLKMHNGEAAAKASEEANVPQAAAQNAEQKDLPGKTEVVYEHAKYKLWAHTKV